MKRASYRDACDWIAWNDDPGTESEETIAEYVSVALVAEIFGVSSERVARDVARLRHREIGRGGW